MGALIEAGLRAVGIDTRVTTQPAEEALGARRRRGLRRRAHRSADAGHERARAVRAHRRAAARRAGHRRHRRTARSSRRSAPSAPAPTTSCRSRSSVETLQLTVERALRHRALVDEVQRLREATRRRRSRASSDSRRAMRAVFDLVARVAPTDAVGADHRRERHRQGAGRARAPPAQPPRRRPVRRHQLRGDARDARSRASCSATRAAPSPTRARRAPASSCRHRRHAVPRRDRRDAAVGAGRSCCARCRSGRFARSAAITRSRSTCASSRRPTAISRRVVEEGRFREDLFYRINVVRIELPPLRARGNDVLHAGAAVRSTRFAHAHGQSGARHLARRPREKLLAYDWPGNVRELQNAHRARGGADALRRDHRRGSAGEDPRLPQLARARRRQRRSRRAADRSTRSSGATSCACSRRCTATRRSPRASSGSIARRSIASSSATAATRLNERVRHASPCAAPLFASHGNSATPRECDKHGDIAQIPAARWVQSYTTKRGDFLVKFLDVLVVDDDVEQACVVARVLRARHKVRIAVGLRDAVHEIARSVPDIIMCAHEMPPYRGDALLAMIASEHPRGAACAVHRSATGARRWDRARGRAKPVDAAELLAAIGERRRMIMAAACSFRPDPPPRRSGRAAATYYYETRPSSRPARGSARARRWRGRAPLSSCASAACSISAPMSLMPSKP